MLDPRFKKGDSVKFVSDSGPTMKVKSVCVTDGADSYLCCWFDSCNTFQTEWFPPELLALQPEKKKVGFSA
jgi:uncharacterized protein YodC (DUF2158 family)